MDVRKPKELNRKEILEAIEKLCLLDDNDPVGKLMHDFRCVSSVDMFYPELARQVKFMLIYNGLSHSILEDEKRRSFLALSAAYQTIS